MGLLISSLRTSNNMIQDILKSVFCPLAVLHFSGQTVVGIPGFKEDIMFWLLVSGFRTIVIPGAQIWSCLCWVSILVLIFSCLPWHYGSVVAVGCLVETASEILLVESVSWY